jgi:hypothetical protein
LSFKFNAQMKHLLAPGFKPVTFETFDSIGGC